LTVPDTPVPARPDFEFTRLGKFKRPLCVAFGTFLISSPMR
jgi:hypothetical protein